MNHVENIGSAVRAVTAVPAGYVRQDSLAPLQDESTPNTGIVVFKKDGPGRIAIFTEVAESSVAREAATLSAMTGAARFWLGLNVAGQVAQFFTKQPSASDYPALRLVEYTCTPAPAAAPIATPEYSYSTNEEEYQGSETSREAALELALSETDADVTTIWTGRNSRFAPGGIADQVIEQLQEQAHDECGEYAEDYLTSVTKEQEAELDRLILDWAARVETPRFYAVTDTQKHDLSELRNEVANREGAAL